jgi:type VI secretion system protein ImpA
MNKKLSDPKPKVVKTNSRSSTQHDWLAPIGEGTPCGPDLEYDHDFMVLFANAASKQEVQYGAFVGSPDPVDWSEIERDCRRLMMRTKDIRVAVLYTRCRTQLAGAEGLAEGTGLLTAWLQAFPSDLHPQPGLDGEREIMLEIRMNALQALADPEGLLSDIRAIVLAKSTITRLQGRDVERAFAQPRPTDALAPESVIQQLQDLQLQQPDMMADFARAAANLAAIEAWCVEHLGTYQPDLSALIRLLARLGLSTPTTAAAAVASVESEPDTDESNGNNPSEIPETESAIVMYQPECTSTRTYAKPADRRAALALIQLARQWFETNEPSSPVPVLLRRAEQCVGKRYAELVRVIPAELLVEWEHGEGG